MSRCGCTTECVCVFVDGACTQVVGDGGVATPYAVNVLIDPTFDNHVMCIGDTGLYVPPPTVFVDQGNCVSLTGDGSVGDPIIAETIISTDPNNLTECVASPSPTQGLRTLLYTLSGSCVSLTGRGTAGDPLTTELVLSGDPGNVLECRGNGAYAPAAAQGVVDRRATLLHTGAIPTVLPPAALGVTSAAFIDYDFIEENVGLLVFIGGGGSFSNTTIEIPVGGAGVYQIEATHPAWSLAPINPAGDMIVRLRLWRNHVPGPALGEGIGQSGDVRFTTTAATYNTPYLHVSRTLRLYDGDAISVDFAGEDYNGAFGAATLDTAPTYGGNGGITPPPAGTGLPFFQITKLGES